MPIRFAQTRQWAAIALLPLAALVSSCSDSNDTPSEPTTPAGITGRITSNFATGVARGVVRVEFNPNNPNDGPKALVTVAPFTTILKLEGDEGEFRDLYNGIITWGAYNKRRLDIYREYSTTASAVAP